MENTTICNDEFKNDMTGITTQSVLDDASDDFDRLLDEFIRKSLEEDAEDVEKIFGKRPWASRSEEIFDNKGNDAPATEQETTTEEPAVAE